MGIREEHRGRTGFVTWGELVPILEEIFENIDERMQNMAEATQADVDNLTTQVQQVATDLTTTQQSLQAEIDGLASSGVDVSGLQAAVAPLDAAVQALGSLKPSQTTPPPPAPAPADVATGGTGTVTAGADVAQTPPTTPPAQS